MAGIMPQPADAQEQEIQKLSQEHFYNMVSVASPQISPDGREIIYTRGWIDKVNDSRRNELFIMDADGKRNRFFTRGSSPDWLPDGTRIAFLAQGKPHGKSPMATGTITGWNRPLMVRRSCSPACASMTQSIPTGSQRYIPST